ncbi:MAG: glycosyltransferase family 4 protein [Pseudomonadota bacterium]
MHILFISDNFPPEVNAPASRTFEHCRRWVESGHRVTVITCVPNFPSGRVFPGYRNRLFQREFIDGITVIRVWSFVGANQGFLLRILDYLSFMITSTIAGLALKSPDIVIGTSPQFFAACAAWMIAAIKRRPFVFELRDLWPESIKAVGAMKSGAAIRSLERIEIFLYRRAAAIISVTHSFKEVLARRGINPAKISVITNGADNSRFYPRPKDQALLSELKMEGKIVVGYIGTHGMAHALETVIDAAERLSGDDTWRFLFLGDGARKPDLARYVTEKKLGNVLFVGSVEKSEVTRYWSLLDISVIHLRDTELFSTVIPSKLFECMAMGIPVALGVRGESADIVEAEAVGLTFPPENSKTLAHTLQRMRDEKELYAMFKFNGPCAAGKYTRSALADRMMAILEALPKRSLTR